MISTWNTNFKVHKKIFLFQHQWSQFIGRGVKLIACNGGRCLTDGVAYPVESQPKKLLKVAILGRPNAGKSTLINRIMQMNVCDVSSKTHTTRFPVRTAFTSRNTQIIFVDTPGVVTNKEFKKFSLSESFQNWQRQVLSEIDIVGVIQEAHFCNRILKLPETIVNIAEEINGLKPIFLVLNKIDLLKDKSILMQMERKRSIPIVPEIPFSKVFYVSALRGQGHEEVVNYLLKQAKENDWILDDGKVCDIPLNILVINLLRAKMLDMLRQEVPYKCTYEVEYLEENEFGEIICVALIKCKRPRHSVMIIGQKDFLKSLCQRLESDLYNILKKVFKIRVVVETSKRN